MKWLYRFRGEILGGLALVLWLLPCSAERISLSAICLAFLGAVLRIEARRVIGEHSRGKEKSAPELVCSGIYAKLRHPLYLSNLCLCLAFILFHLGVCKASLVLALAVALLVFALAKSEDAFLAKRFGDAFLAWKRKTPMFLPNGKGGNSEAAAFEKRNVLGAFWSDRWTWFWILFYTFLLVSRRHLDLPFALNF